MKRTRPGSMQTWFAVLSSLWMMALLTTTNLSYAQPPAPAPAPTAPAPAAPAPAAPAPAGDVTQQCVDAHLSNQQLRKASKLAEARAQLLVCVQEGCPPPIKNDCGNWLAEVDKQIPTIVVTGKDADNKDTTDVLVTIDGGKVADQLDGVPVPLDPGPHEVTCQHKGQTHVEKVVVVQGQKNRPVVCSFAVDAKPPAGGEVDRGHPIAGYVLGVLSLGAFASFAALGAIGKGEADDLDQTCGKSAPAPNTQTCTDDQIDPVRAKLIAADVSLGVGVALLAVSMGLILHHFLSEPDTDDGTTAQHHPTVDFQVMPRWDPQNPEHGGASGVVTVHF